MVRKYYSTYILILVVSSIINFGCANNAVVKELQNKVGKLEAKLESKTESDNEVLKYLKNIDDKLQELYKFMDNAGRNINENYITEKKLIEDVKKAVIATVAKLEHELKSALKDEDYQSEKFQCLSDYEKCLAMPYGKLSECSVTKLVCLGSDYINLLDILKKLLQKGVGDN